MVHRVRIFKVYQYAGNKDKIDIFIIKPDIRKYVPYSWTDGLTFFVDTHG